MIRIIPDSQCKNGECWFIGGCLFAYFPATRPVSDSFVCQARASLMLVAANSPGCAYRKIEAIGKTCDGAEVIISGEKHKQKFVGLADLTPIYEPLTDDAEILDEGWRYARLSTFLKEIPPKKTLLKQLSSPKECPIKAACSGNTQLSPACGSSQQRLIFHDAVKDEQMSWFIGRLVTAYLPLNKERNNDSAFCHANEVMMLVFATTPAHAFRKLEELGKIFDGEEVVCTGRKCIQKFIGLSDFESIDKSFGDGKEFYCYGWRRARFSTLKKELRSKQDMIAELVQIERNRHSSGCAPMWGAKAITGVGNHWVSPFGEQI